MLKYLLLYRWRFLGALALLFAVDAVQLLVPLVIKTAIDSLKGNPQLSSFLTAGLWITVIGLAMFVLRVLWRNVLTVTAHRITTDLRQKMYYKIIYQNQQFFSRWDTGDLMARATNDMGAVRALFSFGVISLFDTVVLGIAALMFMIFLNPHLTVIAIVPLPLLAIIVYVFESRIHKTFKRVQERFSILTTFVQEAFSGIFVVKAFSDENAQQKRFEDQSEVYVEENLKLARLNAIFNPMLILVIALSTVLVLFFGGRDVIRGTFTIGELVAFISYLETLAWPVMAVGFSVNIYQRGTASLKRIEEVSELPLDPRYQQGRQEREATGPVALEVRNLSFGYDERPGVLQDFSVTVSPGKTLGILGRVGSGKSTLVRILTGLVPIPRGVVFFDGVDINDFELGALRSHIGCVPQDPFLFSMSVAENIAFLDPLASPDAIERAASLADMETSIATMPKHYETLLGERGVNLSGGQKQRMTIARTVLRDFPLLILDDCFSSIDTETEERILTRMKPVIEKATTIIITHRISTLRFADYVVILDDGRIVEQGTPAELLARGGRYRDLFEKQQLSDKIERAT